jgi:hypothetical protein
MRRRIAPSKDEIAALGLSGLETRNLCIDAVS